MTEMERIIQDLRILARWDNLPKVVKKAIIQSKKREEIERSKKRVEEDKYLGGVGRDERILSLQNARTVQLADG